MKRQKTLTKRERKALKPRPAQAHNHQHIHCVACGRHIDPEEMRDDGARFVACKHGSQFASCAEHIAETQALLDEHDRTGQPVKTAGAWH
jgi:hypothetical protein